MTKKAIITTHDGREATIVTKASNVLFEDGQTAQDILNDRQDTMITPIITTSTSMSKVGQGDSVDYSENVVDGAYESCVLKGNTKVNLIQEPSSKDVVLPYEFAEGQSVTINDTKESGAVGVELKGQTLVNATGEPIVNLVVNTSSPKYLNKNILKKGTVYTFVYDIEEVTGGASGCWGRFNYTDGTYTNVLDKQYTTGITKVATSFDKDLKNLYVCWIRSHVEGQSVKLRSLMILEGDWTNKELPPYFTGMASCKMPILHTVGKNLFDKTTMEKGSTVYSTGANMDNDDERYIRLKSDSLIKVKENTSYTFNKSNWMVVTYLDKSKKAVGNTVDSLAKKFATPKDCVYIRFRNYNPYSSHEEALKELEDLQLEESPSATTYEPYKSSILSLPEEVVLRSLPNGVCDTFNTKTGVYTQRIGELILDGSLDEYWTDYMKELDTTQAFYTSYNMIGKRYDIISNSFPTITKDELQNSDIEGISSDEGNVRGFVFIRIKKSRLSTQDLDGFKSYLQSNPITVQYELETPIVTKINLPSTLKSWNTTTHIYSEIPESTLYPILSCSNPTYPVILKPSTKYSIVVNSYSNDHTNSAINFNLGGATATTTVGNRVTTVTTPSTLTNEQLVMSGRGNKLNNVMVIEGDVVGDEPYFEGICDCKSPILSNVGKNLTSSFTESSSIQATTGNVVETDEWIVNDEFVKIKKNIPYTISLTGDMGMTNGGWVYVYPYDFNKKFLGRDERKDLGKTNKTFMFDYDCFVKFTCKVKNVTSLQLEEGSIATSYEPYKSNILSCNGDKIELTEDMFEQGTFGTSQTGATYESVKENSNTRIRSKKLIRVKPSTTYRFKLDSSCQMLIGGYDSNQKCLGSEFTYSWLNEKVFTTPANGHYISIAIRKGSGSSNITPSEFNSTGLAIWEVDKTIVLRSLPNGVCDTLNVETGEYVQRISEVMLDGSEDEAWGQYTGGNGNIYYGTFAFEDVASMGDFGHQITICDKLKTPTSNTPSGANNKYSLAPMSNKGSSGFTFSLNHTETVAEAKKWLQANPITVQYLLKEPIVKTVDLSGYPFSYENGHVILSSGSIEQSLTPIIEYSVPTNRNGQIRSNQKMVERHQKELDKLQAIILANLVNSQYNQTLTTLNYELSRV